MIGAAFSSCFPSSGILMRGRIASLRCCGVSADIIIWGCRSFSSSGHQLCSHKINRHTVSRQLYNSNKPPVQSFHRYLHGFFSNSRYIGDKHKVLPSRLHSSNLVDRAILSTSTKNVEESKPVPLLNEGNKVAKSGRAADMKILSTLAKYLWLEDNLEFRVRVVASIGFLVGAKVLNVQVPFLFKHAVDWLTAATGNADALASFTAANSSVLAFFVTPAAVLIGYGIARSGSAAFNELRTAVFSNVALRTIRTVSRKESPIDAGASKRPYGFNPFLGPIIDEGPSGPDPSSSPRMEEGGPITRARAKKSQEELKGLVGYSMEMMDQGQDLSEARSVTMLAAQGEPHGPA